MQLMRWLAALLAVGCFGSAAAQNWPERPVRMVVPWGPGGGTDIVARQLGARLTEMYGQQFPIDNRGGANGNYTSAPFPGSGDGITT